MRLLFIIVFTIIVAILFVVCAMSILRNDGGELIEEFVDGLFEFYETMIQDE